MRKNMYKIVTDHETAREMPGQISYDFGIAVMDNHGVFVEKYNIVNSDVFYGHADEMQSCYYAHKLPKYHEAIASGERIVMNTYEIKMLYKRLMEQYNTNIICAYNAGFDKRAGNNTEAVVTDGKYKYLYPYGTEFWDIMLMASDTICQMASYKKFCEEHGFMTKHKTPRPQRKAETVYRFITNNPDFVEEHQGLADVEIEAAIMMACIKKHKKMRRVLGTKKDAQK